MGGLVSKLEPYTPTAGTRRAFALAGALASRSPASPRLLLLYGPAGAGKTHLMQATLRQARKDRSAARLVYMPAAEAVATLVEAIRQGRSALARLGWRGADVIAVDDLQVLAGRERTQLEVARLLRTAVEDGSRVIGATGGPLSALEVLVAELRKAPALALAQLRPANDRDLRRILVGRLDPARPSRTALRDILASAQGDVRRAIGALNRHRFGRPAPLQG